MRATAHAEKDVRKETREAFKEAGEVVREPWSRELDRFGSKTASGLRTSVRQAGVSVRQSLPKTTGRRPDFGFRQQVIGEAVLDQHRDEVEDAVEEAFDRVAGRFERTP